MGVSVYTSLENVPKDLISNNSFPRQQNFFLSHDWFSHLYKTAFREDLIPRIYLVTDCDGGPSAALYCAVHAGSRTLVSLTNFYSLEFQVVTFCTFGSVDRVFDELIAYISEERPRWRSLDFRYLNSSEVTNAILQKAIINHGFHVNCFAQYENWYHRPGEESYSSYLEQRPTKLRNTLKRKKKRLFIDHRSEIKIYPEEAGLRKLLECYEGVYNASWKKKEPFPEFIPGLIYLCAQLNILILGVLYINGQPAASQLWISLPDKLVIYKLAYDRKFDQQSAGTILSEALFRYAYKTNCPAEIDYGVGSESYKKDWMSEVRTIYGLEAFNRRTIGGLVLNLRFRATSLIKKYL